STPTQRAILYISQTASVRTPFPSMSFLKARNRFSGKACIHTTPWWSPDGEWIYFVHGTGPAGTMDVWRMKPSGESPEQLTQQHADVNFLAPLDLRTLLYVARGATIVTT